MRVADREAAAHISLNDIRRRHDYEAASRSICGKCLLCRYRNRGSLCGNLLGNIVNWGSYENLDGTLVGGQGRSGLEPDILNIQATWRGRARKPSAREADPTLTSPTP